MSTPRCCCRALIAASACCTPLVEAQVQFTEVSIPAGVRHTHDPLGFYDDYRNPFQNNIGSGAAWVDFNGDGWLDLIVTNGTTPGNYFYLNDGDGTFTDVSDAMGMRNARVGMGLAIADVDNNGYSDILLSHHLTEPEIFASGTFTTTNKSSSFGLDSIHFPFGQAPPSYTGPFSMGVAFGDYNNDSFVDAYLANYLIAADVLMKNFGGSTFLNSNLVPEPEHGYGCQPVFVDYDLDGDQDIFVVNDLMRDFLWRNEGKDAGYVLTEVALPTGIAGGNDTSKPLSMGMGGVAADFDNDLDLDIYVTNFRANALWQNPGNWSAGGRITFTNVAPQKGVDFPLNSWGCDFFDADNDGDLDLLMIGGWVVGGPDVQTREVPNKFWINDGPPNYTFTDVTDAAGVGDRQFGRGQAVGDYDRDGDLDVFVTNTSYYDPAPNGYTPPIPGHTLLYRNDLNSTNHWISLRLQGGGQHGPGIGCNRDAIGVRVYAHVGNTTQMRVVSGGSGFLGQNSLELEFGLGAASVVDDLEVRWTCGGVSHYANLPANGFYRLVEFDSRARRIPALFSNFRVEGSADGIHISWRCDPAYSFDRADLLRAEPEAPDQFLRRELAASYESGLGTVCDLDVQTGFEYRYRLVVYDQFGNHSVSPIAAAKRGAPPGRRAELGQNFPNPFNPSTTIRFALPRQMEAHLRLFDAQGRLVRDLYRAVLPADPAHEVHWDGLDDAGDAVASGSYYYVLTTADGTEARKLVLVR